MSKLFGYARVSTSDQDLSPQVSVLIEHGVPEALIFSEKFTGTKREGRLELERVLALLSSGDVLCITRLDRLARSIHDFSRIAHDLKARSIGIRVIQQGIDTSISGSTGALMMNMLASFAEFETELRRERQMEGIAFNKNTLREDGSGKPKYAGGARRHDPVKLKALLDDGKGVAEIVRETGASRRTIYRAIGTA